MLFLTNIPKPQGYIYLCSPFNTTDPTMVPAVLDNMVASYAAAHLMTEGYSVYPAVPICALAYRYGHELDIPTLTYNVLQLASEVWVMMVNDWSEDETVTRTITYAQELGKPIRHFYYSEMTNNLMFLETADVSSV